MPPKVLKKRGWWILPGSRRLGDLVLILGRRADHHMIFHIFSIPFLPWVFHRRLFKVLRKKNEIHCSRKMIGCVIFWQTQNSTHMHAHSRLLLAHKFMSFVGPLPLCKGQVNTSCSPCSRGTSLGFGQNGLTELSLKCRKDTDRSP